jgi:hypothetical protein
MIENPSQSTMQVVMQESSTSSLRRIKSLAQMVVLLLGTTVENKITITVALA